MTNTGAGAPGLEYVSSFALTGLTPGGLLPWDKRATLFVPHHTWQGEGQWKSSTLPELGLSRVNASASLKRLAYTNTGTWSSSQYLPLGYLEDRERGAGLFWQIEHNGSWHWEISDQAGHLSLQLSGPTEQEHQWWKQLEPGETFTTVPVAVGSTSTTILLPTAGYAGKAVKVTCLYPSSQDCHWRWQKEAGLLSVTLPQEYSARLFHLEEVRE